MAIITGTCTYCGRPIYEKDGWYEKPSHRSYCKQHDPDNHVRFIAMTVKAAFAVAEERRITVIEIEDEVLTKTNDGNAQGSLSTRVVKIANSKVGARMSHQVILKCGPHQPNEWKKYTDLKNLRHIRQNKDGDFVLVGLKNLNSRMHLELACMTRYAKSKYVEVQSFIAVGEIR